MSRLEAKFTGLSLSEAAQSSAMGDNLPSSSMQCEITVGVQASVLYSLTPRGMYDMTEKAPSASDMWA